MPKRAQKKRAQRRQHELEKDINTNGIDGVRSGQFRVYDRKAKRYISEPLNWEKALEVWHECNTCIILDAQHTRKGG